MDDSSEKMFSCFRIANEEFQQNRLKFIFYSVEKIRMANNQEHQANKTSSNIVHISEAPRVITIPSQEYDHLLSSITLIIKVYSKYEGNKNNTKNIMKLWRILERFKPSLETEGEKASL